MGVGAAGARVAAGHAVQAAAGTGGRRGQRESRRRCSYISRHQHISRPHQKHKYTQENESNVGSKTDSKLFKNLTQVEFT